MSPEFFYLVGCLEILVNITNIVFMKRLQPIVEDYVAKKLTDEAKENGHKKVGPYAAHLLTKHVAKQEISHTHKKEIK